MCIDDDSKRRRRRLLTATGAATSVALSGCLDQWRRVKEASEDEESTAEDRDDGDDDTETTSESATPTGETLEVAMLLPGSIDDSGFMEAGYDGLQAIEAELGAETTYTEGIPAEMEPLTAALEELAADDPDLIIARGGQNSEAVAAVAPEYSEIKFVVTQGDVTGENLSSYVVLQEQSTFLAGAAAGSSPRAASSAISPAFVCRRASRGEPPTPTGSNTRTRRQNS